MNKNLIISLILAAGAFLFFMLVLPQYDFIMNARAELKSRKALFEERTAIMNKVQELNRQYESKQTDINKVVMLLPEKKRVDQIISGIQQISSQSGLNLTSITSGDSSGEDQQASYKKIFINAEFTGSFPSFINFLKLLEQNLRLCDVFEIIVGTVQNATYFNIKMNAYNLK